MLVLHFAVAVGSAIFEGTNESVPVGEADAALVLQTPVQDAASITAVGLLALLHLVDIGSSIFDLRSAIGLIADEVPLVGLTCCESHLAPANSLIVDPVAVKDVAIRVVLRAFTMSLVVAVLAIIVTPILQEELDPTIGYSALLESAFNDLIVSAEQDTQPMDLVISPLALVQCPTFQLADAHTMPLIGLEGALVDITALQPDGALALAHVLGHDPDVLVDSLLLHGCQLFEDVLQERQVSPIDSVFDAVIYFQRVLYPVFWRYPMTSLDLRLGKSSIHNFPVSDFLCTQMLGIL